jgi:adenine-specific DNA-methyltransferase
MEKLEKIIYTLTQEYTKNTEKTYLKEKGQFFTLDKNIISNLLCDYKYNENLTILEPSVGTGNLLKECIKFKNSVIDAVEIDKNVYEIASNIFKDYDNINFINDDFLTYDFDKSYDLIVSNPPYFELKNEEIDKVQFNEIMIGRTNIYSLFLYKSIKLLKNKGTLIAILPKTILSGKYFSKLRNFIHKECDILDIVKFSKNNLFDKALQSVIILKLYKTSSKKTGEHTVNINNNLYFVKNKDLIFSENNTTTIKKLNCIVKTGQIVWNKYKHLLYDEPELYRLPLILASNIKNNTLLLKEGENTVSKKQYMKITEGNKIFIEKGSYILINRIVGGDCKKLNIYFQKDAEKTGRFIENHVNIIRGSVKDLEIIHNSLNNPKTILFIQEFLGSTQLSQYELENIIPIYNCE